MLKFMLRDESVCFSYVHELLRYMGIHNCLRTSGLIISSMERWICMTENNLLDANTVNIADLKLETCLFTQTPNSTQDTYSLALYKI